MKARTLARANWPAPGRSAAALTAVLAVIGSHSIELFCNRVITLVFFRFGTGGGSIG